VFGECACEPQLKDGYQYVPWMGQFLAICAWTPIEILSVVFGLVNIVLWLFAQAPQVYETWRRKKAEAIHPLFLAAWLLGDITNLMGCILTNQTPVQLYTAIYFCSFDCVLLSQWFYYSKIYKPSSEKKTASCL